jgi:hypothetical protein
MSVRRSDPSVELRSSVRFLAHHALQRLLGRLCPHHPVAMPFQQWADGIAKATLDQEYLNRC